MAFWCFTPCIPPVLQMCVPGQAHGDSKSQACAPVRLERRIRVTIVTNKGPAMKTCKYCGRENDDPATKCQECGQDLASTNQAPTESGDTERFEKVAVLDNEVQAELMDEVLSERKIPHIMQTYHDSALDGLFQTGKGWGVILAHPSASEEILAALADVRRQSQSASDAPESNKT